MSFSNRANWEAYKILQYTSLSGTFTALGSPLQQASKVLKLINTTDADVIVSFDGVTLQDYIPAGGFCLYDISCNAFRDGDLTIAKGTQIFVKQAAATSKGTVVAVAYS